MVRQHSTSPENQHDSAAKNDQNETPAGTSSGTSLGRQQQDVLTMLNLRSELRNQKIDSLVQWHESMNYKDIMFETPPEMESNDSILDWAWDHHSNQASSKITTIVHQMKRGLARLRTLKASVYDAMEKAKLATELEKVVKDLEKRLDDLEREKREQAEALNMFRLHMKEKDNMLNHTLKREEHGMKKVQDIRDNMRHLYDRRDQTIRDLMHIAHYKDYTVADIIPLYNKIKETYDNKEPQLLEESISDSNLLKLRTNELHQQLMIDVLNLHQGEEDDMQLIKMILDTDLHKPDTQIRKWVRKKLKERRKDAQIKQKEQQRRQFVDARKKRLARSSSNVSASGTENGVEASEMQHAQQYIATLEQEKLQTESKHKQEIDNLENSVSAARRDLIESQQYIQQLKDQLKKQKIKPLKRKHTLNKILGNDIETLTKEKKDLTAEMKRMASEKNVMEKKLAQEKKKSEKEKQKLLQQATKEQKKLDQEKKKSEKEKQKLLQQAKKEQKKLEKQMKQSVKEKKSKISHSSTGKKKKKRKQSQQKTSSDASPSKDNDHIQQLIQEEREKFYEHRKKELEQLAGPTTEHPLYVVFTDVKSSTNLWKANSESMIKAIQLYHSLLRSLIQQYSGYEFRNENDTFGFVFKEARSAMDFALQVQIKLLELDWPSDILQLPEAAVETNDDDQVLFCGLRVRVGLHVGETLSETNSNTQRTDYFGPVVKLAEKVMRRGEGGEICISDAVWSDLEGIRGEQSLQDLFCMPIQIKYRGRIPIDATGKHLEEIRTVLPEQLAEREFERDRLQKERISNKRIDAIVSERMEPVLQKSRVALDAALSVEDSDKSRELVALIEEISSSANHVIKKKELESAAAISSQCNAALMELYELRRMSIDVRRSLRQYGEQFFSAGRDFEDLLSEIQQNQQTREEEPLQDRIHSIKEERMTHLDSIKKTTNTHVQNLSDLIQSMDEEIQSSIADHEGENSNGEGTSSGDAKSHSAEEKLRTIRKQIIRYQNILKEQEKHLDDLRQREEDLMPPEEQLEQIVAERVQKRVNAILIAKHQEKGGEGSNLDPLHHEDETRSSTSDTDSVEGSEQENSTDQDEGEVENKSQPKAKRNRKRKNAASLDDKKSRNEVAPKTEAQEDADADTEVQDDQTPSSMKKKKGNRKQITKSLQQKALTEPGSKSRKETTKVQKKTVKSTVSSAVKTEKKHRVSTKRAKQNTSKRSEEAAPNDSDYENEENEQDSGSQNEEHDQIETATSTAADNEENEETPEDPQDVSDENDDAVSIPDESIVSNSSEDEGSDSEDVEGEPSRKSKKRRSSKLKSSNPKKRKSTDAHAQSKSKKSKAKSTKRRAKISSKDAHEDDHSEDVIEDTESTFSDDSDIPLEEHDDNEDYQHDAKHKDQLYIESARDEKDLHLNGHTIHTHSQVSQRGSKAESVRENPRIVQYKREIQRLRRLLVDNQVPKAVIVPRSHQPPRRMMKQKEQKDASKVEDSSAAEEVDGSPSFDFEDTIPPLPVYQSIEIQTLPIEDSTDDLDEEIIASPLDDHDHVHGSQMLSPQSPSQHKFPQHVPLKKHPLSPTNKMNGSPTATRLKPRVVPAVRHQQRSPHTLQPLDTQRNSTSNTHSSRKVVYLSPLPKEEEAMHLHEKKRMNKKHYDLVKLTKKLAKREQELERKELELNLKLKEMQAQLRASSNQYYGIPADTTNFSSSAKQQSPTEKSSMSPQQNHQQDDDDDLYYVPKFWNVFYPTIKNPARRIRARARRKHRDSEREDMPTGIGTLSPTRYTQGTATLNVRRSFSDADMSRRTYRVNRVQDNRKQESAMSTVNASGWLSRDSVKKMSFTEFVSRMVENDVRQHSVRINNAGFRMRKILGGWMGDYQRRGGDQPMWR